MLTPAFAASPDWVVDHRNHSLIHIGDPGRVPVPRLRQLALAHYPVSSAAQVTNKTILGYLAHLAASRPEVEERRVATHWRRCCEEIVLQGATRCMTEQEGKLEGVRFDHAILPDAGASPASVDAGQHG